jgi:hypothetical protein
MCISLIVQSRCVATANDTVSCSQAGPTRSTSCQFTSCNPTAHNKVTRRPPVSILWPAKEMSDLRVSHFPRNNYIFSLLPLESFKNQNSLRVTLSHYWSYLKQPRHTTRLPEHALIHDVCSYGFGRSPFSLWVHTYYNPTRQSHLAWRSFLNSIGKVCRCTIVPLHCCITTAIWCITLYKNTFTHS